MVGKGCGEELEGLVSFCIFFVSSRRIFRRGFVCIHGLISLS